MPSLARKAVEPASQGMTDEAARLSRGQQQNMQSHPLLSLKKSCPGKILGKIHDICRKTYIMLETTLEQKEKIREGLKLGKTYKEIATELNMNKRTVKKWGQKIKKGEDMSPKTGRPVCGTLGSFSAEIKNLIDEYRPYDTGWGAKTIKIELVCNEDIKNKKKPSLATINRYLKERGRIRPYRIVKDLPSEPCYPADVPHQVWQLDAEGNKVIKNIGALCVINIKDIRSKAYIQSYPLRLKSKHNHPTRKDYQHCLRIAFMEFGLCEKLQLDHESVFYENTDTSPFPTPLHLWLIGLGVTICYTPKGKPYKQGMVEKSHQTMHTQVFKRKDYKTWEDVLQECWCRRNRLNNDIPCRMLEDKTPFEAFPSATHSGLKYHPNKEKKLFSQKRIYEYLSMCTWYRRVSKGKAVSLGAQRYGLSLAIPCTDTKISFNVSTQCFEFYDSNANLIQSKKPKGLSFEELCSGIPEFMQWYKKHRHLIKK